MAICRDAPRPIPWQLCSERNIRRGGLAIRPRLPVCAWPKCLVAQFMDERTWRPAEIAVGLITGRERYFGITNRDHLLCEVGQDYWSAWFRSVEIFVEAELGNRLLRRGDLDGITGIELRVNAVPGSSTTTISLSIIAGGAPDGAVYEFEYSGDGGLTSTALGSRNIPEIEITGKDVFTPDAVRAAIRVGGQRVRFVERLLAQTGGLPARRGLPRFSPGCGSPTRACMSRPTRSAARPAIASNCAMRRREPWPS